MIFNNGYVYIKDYNHPNSDCAGRISRSRYRMSNMIGRPLKKREVVHHKNKDRSDDRPENLKLLKDNGKHNKIHGKDHRKYKISYKDIEKLIRNETINLTELRSRLMNKFRCSHMTAERRISDYIDNFEVWYEGGNKFFKVITR